MGTLHVFFFSGRERGVSSAAVRERGGSVRLYGLERILVPVAVLHPGER